MECRRVACATLLRGVCAVPEGEDQRRVGRVVIHLRARRKYHLVKTIRDHDFLRDKNLETPIDIGLQGMFPFALGRPRKGHMRKTPVCLDSK